MAHTIAQPPQNAPMPRGSYEERQRLRRQLQHLRARRNRLFRALLRDPTRAAIASADSAEYMSELGRLDEAISHLETAISWVELMAYYNY